MNLSININHGKPIFTINYGGQLAGIILGRFGMAVSWSNRWSVYPVMEGKFYQKEICGNFECHAITLGRFQFGLEVKKRQLKSN